MVYMKKHLLPGLIALLFVLAACAPAPSPGATTETPAPTVTPQPLPSPTPAPRGLTVCLGREPNTLYLYGNPNNAARSVLAAIYDGPMDVVSYQYQPVILERRPSFTNGDARIASVEVRRGEMIVDANGVLRPLDFGVRVRPSGCYAADCAIEYQGGLIKMDQLVVTFSLLPNLTWSDGVPLTAYDSVYAFQLDAHPDTPTSKYLTDRTYTYEAVDDLSVEWWSVPGFIYHDYPAAFWSPLPKHLLEETAPADLPQSPIASRAPVGWGPYILREWLPGDRIVLDKNPNYFRANEGLPYFDFIVYRFTSSLDQALADLQNGACDVLDPSLAPETAMPDLLQLQSEGKIQLATALTDIMERIDFGIRPAAYDNGYAPGPGGDRPDFFGDVRTRQAFALCLDRQAIIDQVLFGLSSIPSSFVPPAHPLYFPLARQYAYDPEAGKALLDAVGWRDTDNDPATPRVAVNISGIPNQTPLILSYRTTNTEQRRQASDLAAASLSACGIQVTLEYTAPVEFYAEGPGGPLFGRQFDLAQYAMAVPSGLQPPCDWFTSTQIPTAANRWQGVNVSGYNNAEYDRFCLAARAALPETERYYQNYENIQAAFAEGLPSIPLYWRVRIAAASPAVCDFALDTSAAFLWNLETLSAAPCVDG